MTRCRASQSVTPILPSERAVPAPTSLRGGLNASFARRGSDACSGALSLVAASMPFRSGRGRAVPAPTSLRGGLNASFGQRALGCLLRRIEPCCGVYAVSFGQKALRNSLGGLGTEAGRRYRTGFLRYVDGKKDIQKGCQAKNPSIPGNSEEVNARRFPKGDRKALWRGVGAELQAQKAYYYSSKSCFMGCMELA